MAETPNLTRGSAYVLAAFFFMAFFATATKVAASGGSQLWVSFITYLTGAGVILRKQE